MDEKERGRALTMTLGQIEKQFGKGSILRLGASARERYQQFYRPEIMAREMEKFFTGMLRR